MVPGPDPDHVWVQQAVSGSDSEAIRLVTMDGRPAGVDLRLPANVDGFITPDGGGYPLVTTTGGAYDVRGDGLHRITAGAVEAVGRRAGWSSSATTRTAACVPSSTDRPASGGGWRAGWRPTG